MAEPKCIFPANDSAPTHIEIQSGSAHETKLYCGIFQRSIHFKSALANFVLWISLIIAIAAAIDFESYINLVYFIFPFIIYPFYALGAVHCGTAKYLKKLNPVEDVVMYVNRIQKVVPTLWIKACCSHGVLRTRQVNEHYTDSNGQSQSRLVTETYMDIVVTHSETEPIEYSRFENAGELTEAIRAWDVIRIEYTKSWEPGDENTRRLINEQIERITARNKNRDVEFSCSVDCYLEGFEPNNVLSIVNLANRPSMLSWKAYIVVSLVFLSSWPYKLWFDRRTTKGQFDFKKVIYK